MSKTIRQPSSASQIRAARTLTGVTVSLTRSVKNIGGWLDAGLCGVVISVIDDGVTASYLVRLPVAMGNLSSNAMMLTRDEFVTI